MKPILLYLALLALPLTANALDGPASPQQQETEGWLKLQISHQAASHTPQTSTATERELSMQRWLKSYQHEIPMFFDQEEGGTVNGGAGGSVRLSCIEFIAFASGAAIRRAREER